MQYPEPVTHLLLLILFYSDACLMFTILHISQPLLLEDARPNPAGAGPEGLQLLLGVTRYHRSEDNLLFI
jgi:hypothetical protein